MKLKFHEIKPIRLDKYLVNLNLPELYSRSFIEHLITGGFIQVEGKVARKSHLLKDGEEIQIEIPPPPEIKPQPENIPLNVVWEDEYLLIVDKPAGLTVHPAPGNRQGTLVNALLHHYQDQLADGDPLRPGIVHRLDKDTSGLLLVAKDNRTRSLLTSQFQARQINKYYLALTAGLPAREQGIISSRMGRSQTDRKKMMVADTGREAVTHYHVERYFDYFCLMKVRIETGRTHQIRVHLSHINCPVLGDQTYSSLKRILSQIPFQHHKKIKYLLTNHLHRQALHACRLVFQHPVTGNTVDVSSPLPEDIKYCLSWLEHYFSH
ncbi:MAG: RluA family pseudouridine synthase [Candidatus Cloacimonetes bacterium]|nr:RluA family pseudouridine synthase [Candidatus Cloacimonadota bacterium]